MLSLCQNLKLDKREFLGYKYINNQKIVFDGVDKVDLIKYN